MKINRKDLVLVAVLFMGIIIFFGDNVFSGKLFCFRDIGRYYYPAHFFAAESLQTGRFPFWNPYMFCGFPFFASLQHALLYPLSILCYLFPFYSGFNYYFIAHFLLAAAGMYLLLRTLGLSRFSTAAGTLIFIFGGYLVSMLNLLTTLSAVIWFPFLWVLYHRSRAGEKWGYLPVLSLVLSLQFLSGQPEIMFFSFIIMVLYLIYGAIADKTFRLIWLPAGKLLLACGLSLLFICVQAIPFAELITASIRESSTTANITVWSFHPLEALNFLLPSFTFDFMAGSTSWFGQGWLRSGYLGALSLILVGFGFAHRHRDKKYFLLLAGLGLLLALGRHLPYLDLVFKYLPGFNIIRYPVKYLALFFFALSPLAAFGLESIRQRRSSLAGSLAMFCGAGLLLASYVIFALTGDRIMGFLSSHYLRDISPLEKYLVYRKVSWLLRDLVYALVFAAGGAVILWLRSKEIITEATFKTIFLVLVTASLFYGSYRVEPTVAGSYYREPTDNVRFMKDNLQGQRLYLSPKSSQEVVRGIAVYPQIDFREEFYKRQKALLPNLGNIYHLSNMDGYESVKLRNNEHLTNYLASHQLQQSAPVLDLLGVKYLLSFYPLPVQQFDKVRENYVGFYRNRHDSPRARLFSRVSFLKEQSLVDKRFLAADFDPLTELVVNADKAEEKLSPADMSPGSRGAVTSFEDNVNSLIIGASLTKPAWLLLADTFYPGWQVFVDKQPARLYRADYMLRAVYLPDQTKEIEFRYWPTNFVWALVISLLTCLALIIYLGRVL